jgi:mannose-6-phosphate isomerase-like protein (cupin superfamily)
LALATREGSISDALALSPNGWERRPKALRFTSFRDQPELTFARGKAHARIAFGAHDPQGLRPSASLTLLYSDRDTGVPPNVHEHEWEHLAILDGEGIMLLGDEHLVLGPGAVYEVPEKVEHGFTPNGNRPLVAIQLFSPPGPEQRFALLASAPPQEPKTPESPKALTPR